MSLDVCRPFPHTHSQDNVAPGHVVTLLEGLSALIAYVMPGQLKGKLEDLEVCCVDNRFSHGP